MAPRLLAVDDESARATLVALTDAFERETLGEMDVLRAGTRAQRFS